VIGVVLDTDVLSFVLKGSPTNALHIEEMGLLVATHSHVLIRSGEIKGA
jgi:hypothetical protein